MYIIIFLYTILSIYLLVATILLLRDSMNSTSFTQNPLLILFSNLQDLAMGLTLTYFAHYLTVKSEYIRLKIHENLA